MAERSSAVGSDGPLGRARQALLEAKARVDHSPSTPNLKALEEAQAHMDYLLECLPLNPGAGDAHRSPAPVSFPSVPPHEAERLMRECQHGDTDSEGV